MESKRILVTGAAKGIGLAIVEQLHAKGHTVFLAARNFEAAEKAARKFGERVTPLLLDVTSQPDIANAVKEVAKRVEYLDTLINNAGILLDDGDSALNVSSACLQETFATNTFAPLAVAQAFLPLLKKSKTPRVINVSSGAGQLADGELSNWAPAYSASKAALNALTQQLAAALPGFAVNAACPGWCKTGMGGANAPRTVDQGADGIVWLAVEAPQKLTGKFLRDRMEISW